LRRAEPLITETLKLEETRFKQTLDRGLKLLDEASGDLQSGASLDGETAFKLYDTYGFPLDLTQDALKARGIAVDTDGFNAAMARQKAEARAAWAGSGDAATETVWFDLREDIGATEFLGYETESAEGVIRAIVTDGAPATSAGPGANVALLANQTPFYGESGGQMGDTGVIETAEGARIVITDTQKKLGALHVHLGKVETGTVSVGDDCRLTVDHSRRSELQGNHSATHLLHEALRERLGNHVTQKGSLVAADRLRFDISHPKPLSSEELAQVETDVNAQIRVNAPVITRLMDPEAAVEAGAMALFGEKYGDEVRVVSMGSDPETGTDKPYSVELCGGTHVSRTGDIGSFKILSESAVAAGVRRIEAVTGSGVDRYLAEQEGLVRDLAALLKAPPAELPARISQLLDDRRKLESEISDLRRKLATGGGAGGSSDVKEIAGIKFAPKLLEGVPAKDLKSLADDIKGQLGSGVAALVSVVDGKVSLVVGVTPDLADRFSAVDLVRAGSTAVGGKGGGGRPDMAQAGGPDGAKAGEALTAIEAVLAG
ncbi:MAG: alanine--tRNA ligase, partial [Rhodospirillales bacterium]